MLYCVIGLRVLAPPETIKQLKANRLGQDYTIIARTVVDVTRVTKKGGAQISRKIKVGVMTVEFFECILNAVSTLLSKGMLLPLARRFYRPSNVPLEVRDVLL